jgi:plastocyanin
VLRSWRTDAVLVASLVLLSAGGAASQSATGARTHSVTIENMQFSPATLTVHRGDRIVWVNKDLFPHTVTATNKVFDSGAIAAGGSWTYVANKVGEFPYGCIFHPTMQGSLTVQ